MADVEFNQFLAREDFGRLLAGCYYQPEAQLGEEDVFGSLLRAGEQLDPTLAALALRLGEAFAAQPVETLLLDYSRLFLGPFDIPAKPYGSIWLEGPKTAMGDSTMAVLELYREGGFDLDENFHEVPDHIAAELEFLYLLNFQAHEARNGGLGEAQGKSLALKQRLLQNHLGRWVTPFTDAMKAAAETPFYQILAELTARYVQLEAQEGQE